jgi:hypothetical protein
MNPDPSLRQAIDRVLADFRSTLHTSFPARVLRYDAAKQQLDVRPALQRETGSDAHGAPYDYERMPDLCGLPVMWPRAGGFAITFPIDVGDWVLVLAAEQSTGPWRVRGQAPSPPGLNDPHGLNGCVCLPGWFPDSEKLTDVSTTDLVLGNASGSVRIKPDGTVELGGSAGGGFVALAELVRSAIAAAITGHTHMVTISALNTATSSVNGVLAAPVGNVAAVKVKAT